MPPSLWSIAVGSLLGLCSALSFALNLAILLVLLRSKLPRSNPIYVLSALNLFSDCLQNGGILLFLTPTSIAQDYLFSLARPNEAIWMVFMFVFQIQWYSAIFILIAISVNRLIAVVFPSKSHLINRGAVLWTAASIFPISLFLTIIADFLLPCCRTNYSFSTYSYQFFVWKSSANYSASVNYKNILLDLPLNIGATAILFFCYGIIFLKVLESNRKEVVRKSMEMGQKNRRMGEIRYALQFGLISAFFIAAWVSFRIFPAFLPNVPEWYSLTAFFEIGNCSANALIYMTMNQEVKALLVNSMRSALGLPSLSTVTSQFHHQQQPSKGASQNGGIVISTAVMPFNGEMAQKKISLPAPMSAEKWANRVWTAKRKCSGNN